MEHQKGNIGNDVVSATSSMTASITLSAAASSRSSGRILMPNLIRKDFQIRNKYLQKLGVVPPSSRASAKCPSQQKAFDLQDQLKECNLLKKFEYISPLDVASLEKYPDPNRRRSVSFDSSVHIRVILNKKMYSRRTKCSLWYTPEELDQNSRRNSFEFEAENWDWRRAVEDEQFVTCPKTGEKVHPAHFHWLDHITARRWQHPRHRRVRR